MQLRPAKGYSKFVTASKKLCALIVLLIVVSIFAFPFFSPKRKKLELNLSPQEVTEVKEIEAKSFIVNPKFFGVNKDNEQYNVNASKAIERDNDKVFLESPIADVLLKDKKRIHLVSQEGLWEQLKKNLLINGEVKLNYDNYNVNTNSAILDISTNNIIGKDQVQVEGPLGKLNANGFTILNETKKMIFTGQVKAILYKE